MSNPPAENLARAKVGFQPKITAGADLGLYRDSTKPSLDDCSRPFVGETLTNIGCDPYNTRTTPRGVGLQINQNLFDGFRTTNSIRQAKSQISAAQATTRSVDVSCHPSTVHKIVIDAKLVTQRDD